VAKRFNVRVYGILIKNNKVLVSDEFIKGHHITKFPGGGLEFGEGSKECIIREFKEELDLDIVVRKHFYTTDFFVHSAFDTNSQVISIYYLVDTKQEITFRTTEKIFDYEKAEGAQSMRWIDLKKISDNDLTLIIDKKVGEMLYKKFGKKQ
jgi:ADP-ribose pyrophosphatase YjhB (NUDIX family)